MTVPLKSRMACFSTSLGAHVEVVGRLVEDEQIDRLEQQPYHGQPRALATREHLHLLVRRFAAKHEGTQDVAYLGADIAHRHAVYRLEHGERLVEQARLVLGKVADLHIVPYLEGTGVGNLAHDTLDHGRLTLAVLSHKGHLLAPLDGKGSVGKYQVVAITLAHPLGNDGIVARPGSRRELQVQVRGIHLVDLDPLELGQLLDARLHLHRLSGLVAEPLDEGLGILYLFLLVFIGPAAVAPDALAAAPHSASS